MDIVSSVKSIVENAINAYQRFQLLSVQCNAYRRLLRVLFAIIKDIEEQLMNGSSSIHGNGSIPGNGLSQTLEMIREAVDSGTEVLKKCSEANKIRMFLCSMGYLGRLAESKATIQDALSLLPACGIVVQATEWNKATKAIEEIRSSVDRLSHKLIRKGFIATEEDTAPVAATTTTNMEDAAAATVSITVTVAAITGTQKEDDAVAGAKRTLTIITPPPQTTTTITSSTPTSLPAIETITVVVPPGKLRIVIEQGMSVESPLVTHMMDGNVIQRQLKVNDHIIQRNEQKNAMEMTSSMIIEHVMKNNNKSEFVFVIQHPNMLLSSSTSIMSGIVPITAVDDDTSSSMSGSAASAA